jgi:hypothetical protein
MTDVGPLSDRIRELLIDKAGEKQTAMQIAEALGEPVESVTGELDRNIVPNLRWTESEGSAIYWVDSASRPSDARVRYSRRT